MRYGRSLTKRRQVKNTAGNMLVIKRKTYSDQRSRCTCTSDRIIYYNNWTVPTFNK